jgi:hypothetical protein
MVDSRILLATNQQSTKKKHKNKKTVKTQYHMCVASSGGAGAGEDLVA